MTTTTNRPRKKLKAPNGRPLTQKEIAASLGIPQSTADKMIRGETRMGIHMVVDLWRAYDVGPIRAIEWAHELASRYNAHKNRKEGKK